jgi:hypothetical protein
MIGSIESVTQPLGAAFESIFGTLSTTFELIIQIGTDLGGVINGLVRMIPGVSKSFDVLRFVVTALLSPFRLLELMIMGLYEGYLRIKEKFFGLSDDEKRKKNELFQQRMEKTASLELDFKQAYNKKSREEYQKELNFLKARGAGGEERARIVESALKQIDAKLRTKPTPSTTGNKPATTTKPGTGVDAALRALGGDPAKKLNLPTLKGAGGSTNIPRDLQKTAQTPAAVRTGTDKTTAAVKELTAKTTTQSSLQTTVAAIYSLMASGMLRVQTNMSNMPGMPGMPGATSPFNGTTGPLNADPNSWSGSAWKTLTTKPKVANAFGPSNPAFFSTTSAAEKWERAMVRGSVKVGSVTSNSSEGFGAGTTINGGIHVTVNGSGVNDADALASMVAIKIGEAVSQARSASVFV